MKKVENWGDENGDNDACVDEEDEVDAVKEK